MKNGKAKTADEYDAVAKVPLAVFENNSGLRKKAKKSINRRVRREIKEELKEEEYEFEELSAIEQNFLFD